MDLFTSGHVERLEEGVHVFPAVELTETTELSRHNREESVPGAVTVDKLFNVCRLDLAAVVDDFTIGIDERLRNVESGVINLRKSERDVAISA